MSTQDHTGFVTGIFTLCELASYSPVSRTMEKGQEGKQTSEKMGKENIWNIFEKVAIFSSK